MRHPPSEHLYAPFYCEENVWYLCLDPRVCADERLVVFITNASRTVALWCQRAAAELGQPLIWDYHAVMFARTGDIWQVFDVDTTLDVPCPADEYLRATFRGGQHVPVQFRPHFRLVGATEFVRTFASDRSHMRDDDGRLVKPVPLWPPIGPEGAPSNLMRFVDLTVPFIGEVVDLPRLVARLAAPAASTT